jgi:hypothetical protein
MNFPWNAAELTLDSRWKISFSSRFIFRRMMNSANTLRPFVLDRAYAYLFDSKSMNRTESLKIVLKSIRPL